jgi:hypothetical protein
MILLRRPPAHVIALCGACLSLCAIAQPGPAPIQARRAPSALSIDGKLDDPAWESAVPFDRFVETFPRDGAPAPAELRTEVRVLFDDEFLYVGIRAFDPDPMRIVGQLSRRDTLPTSDYVEVSIDPARQGDTGYSFIVNAAGVQRDVLLYGDVNFTESWDTVWDGNAQVDARGWTAELAIPVRVLRFTERPDLTWDLNIRRVVPRTHQTFDSSYVPRNANPQNPGALVVSRFGPLVELSGLTPQRELEIAPYLGVRATSRPQFSDPSRPRPTLLHPTADVGLDVKAALTSSLNLAAAVNPDFGQVEADQIIQNVQNFEQFFPEKRPFFTQGLDLFQPLGAEYGTNQQLFYSRRIGLDAPILGAVKLTGSIRDGTEIGFLDAVVMGASNPSIKLDEDLTEAEAAPDRRFQFHPTQPFHFAPNDSLPAERPVTRNQFAAVVRQKVGATSTVGGMFTSSIPLAPRCTAADFEDPTAFAEFDCSVPGANAVALDGIFKTADGVWGAIGQLTASHVVGGPEHGTRLRDGTVLAPGDLGHGFIVRVGKLGGEPFRFNVDGNFLSPKLDVNALGFQSFSDYQWYSANLQYVRPSGWGPFPNVRLNYRMDGFNWSADGRFRRGNNHTLSGELQLPSFDTVFADMGFEDPEYDNREIPGAGIAFERTADVLVAAGVQTDPNRSLSGRATLVGIHFFDEGPIPGGPGHIVRGSLVWHPTSFLETRLEAETASRRMGARFLSADQAQNALFGLQHPSFLTVTLRQQAVLARRLTLQAYAQLFSGVVRYSSFFAAGLAGRERLDVDELVPVTFVGNVDQHFSALNLNLVLRWEYRLGSTLFVVYTRSQQELPPLNGIASRSLFPDQLSAGPVTQTFLVKWSYWWDV